MAELNYSIIIPHHNIPDLLTRLLDTIPLREDLEIIIVDDNSDPSIVDFENFPGKNRKNTKIILDKKGGGGGYARNLGLKEAKGKWIIFADSDDFYNYCFAQALEDYKDNPEDIIFFKANSMDCDYYTYTLRTEHLNNFINEYEVSPSHAELMLRYKFGEPWCKFVKHSLITENNISFQETSIHNDTKFSYTVGYAAKSVGIDKRAIYCVTTRPNSVSLGISQYKMLERIKVFTEAAVFFKEHNIPVEEKWHFEQLYKSKKENIDTYKKGCQIVIDHGISQEVIDNELKLIDKREKKINRNVRIRAKAKSILYFFIKEGR